jgi:hypothetical protein
VVDLDKILLYAAQVQIQSQTLIQLKILLKILIPRIAKISVAHDTCMMTAVTLTDGTSDYAIFQLRK